MRPLQQGNPATHVTNLLLHPRNLAFYHLPLEAAPLASCVWRSFSPASSSPSNQMKHEGAAGLFKGIGPQIGSQLLATGLLFGIQDCFRNSLARSTGASRDDLRVIATAGFAAGATLAVVTCPMELLKVDLQACTGPAAASSGASLAACRVAAGGAGGGAVLAAGPSGHAVSSMVRSIGTANRIISQYGAGALYTGVGLTSMRCAVGNFAYFGLYEFLQRTDASERTVAKNGVYGALAGTAYWLACYPLDLMKSKEQCKLIESSSHGGGIKPVPWRYIASRTVEKSMGKKVMDMYKGIGVTLLRGVPVSAVGWMVFGFCQETFGLRS